MSTPWCEGIIQLKDRIRWHSPSLQDSPACGTWKSWQWKHTISKRKLLHQTQDQLRKSTTCHLILLSGTIWLHTLKMQHKLQTSWGDNVSIDSPEYVYIKAALQDHATLQYCFTQAGSQENDCTSPFLQVDQGVRLSWTSDMPNCILRLLHIEKHRNIAKIWQTYLGRSLGSPETLSDMLPLHRECTNVHTQGPEPVPWSRRQHSHASVSSNANKQAFFVLKKQRLQKFIWIEVRAIVCCYSESI